MKTIIVLLLSAAFAAFSASASGMEAREDDTLSVWVNGLCDMCKQRIEETALGTRGVTEATWNRETRMLSLKIEAERFREERLHYQIASAGHDTRQLLAPDPVYNALPMCCHYRDLAAHPGDEPEAAHGHDAGDHRPDNGPVPVVSGTVFETDESGGRVPLSGANVYWMGTTRGTITDGTGAFTIPMEEAAHMLIVSFVGYGTDTLHIHEPAQVEVGFSKAMLLEEVRVVHRIKPTSVSFRSAYNVQNIHEKELTKAACCNLSESFETNPSVDATFTDAVTGTRKIEMLGLAGPYVQITRENMPDVRGLSALYGLTYIPGTWIEGIQLNTGAGSVVNGFESITGQINVELRKPENSDRLFLNAYGNSDGAIEANLMTSFPIGKDVHGGLLLHGNNRSFKLDHNMDGFSDHPTGSTLVALQRFSYQNEKGFESQLGIRVVYADHLGGETGFDPDILQQDQASWGSRSTNKRIEAWTKTGKIFQNRPYSSMGLQVSGLYHSQDASYGLSEYDAEQKSLYSNLIYQSILGNTNHQYRTGVSFQVDSYSESLAFGDFDRMEWVPGAFLEYTFNHMDRFTAVAGIRVDHHNLYGTFATPRLHLRYEPVEKTVFRASAGRGQKTASIFAENIGIFASSRSIALEGDKEGKPYGLEAEVAWSYGLNFAQGFHFGGQDAVVNVDYYYTRFMEQVVVDLDRSAREVHFYNLDGPSFSHSLQVQADLEPFERYDLRLAYRFNDVRTTYGDALLSRPLSSRNRAFINMAYETTGKWTFDVTWHWQDSKRIPKTDDNPEPYRIAGTSPSYSLVNLQVGKTFLEKLDLYAGVENLFGFTQENPIISADDPFGPYFDASLIWGPIFGRKIYAGMRFRLN